MRIVFPIVLILSALVALLLILAFKRPMKASFLLDGGDTWLRLNLIWPPVFRMEAELEETGTQVRAFLFGLKIPFRRRPGGGKRNLAVLRALSLSGTSLQIRYGLNAPYLTGMLFGALSVLDCMAGEIDLEQCPDFFPWQESLYLEGTTDVNLGKTLLNLIRLKAGK